MISIKFALSIILIINIRVFGLENDTIIENSTKTIENIEVEAVIRTDLDNNTRDSHIGSLDANTEGSLEEEVKIETKIPNSTKTTTNSSEATTVSPFVELFSPVQKSVKQRMKINDSTNLDPNIYIISLVPVDPVATFVISRRYVPIIHAVSISSIYQKNFGTPNDFHDFNFHRPVSFYNILHYPAENYQAKFEDKIDNSDNESAETHHQDGRIDIFKHIDDISSAKSFYQHFYNKK